jgi:2-keto-4-pentenoate hydratase/2-oxohepta-3-ene-1,7-dioic acid hydratase in catechol pathway
VMGKRASRVTADNAMEHVLGLTCLIDVTARELQRKEIQYTRAKGFDTFAPIGPCIAVGLDPSALNDFYRAADRRVHLERHDAAPG